MFNPISGDALKGLDAPAFADLRRRIPTGRALETLIGNYEATIYKWLPMLSIKRLRQDANTLNNTNSANVQVLVFLALEAFMTQALTAGDGKDATPYSNAAYVAVKRYSFLAENGGSTHIRLLQTLTLIALYELGHGIYPAAYLTVGRAVRLGTMIGLHGPTYQKQLFGSPETWTLCEEQRRTWWAILMLDRSVLNHSFRHQLPRLIRSCLTNLLES